MPGCSHAELKAAVVIAEYEAGRKDFLQTTERLLSIQPTPWRAIADFHARHSLFLEAR